MSSTIRVLTWNISFGAMTGSDQDKTSLPLPEVCRSKLIPDDLGVSFTQCLMNVVDTIDKSAESQSYDFVALQEASNWNIIFSKSKELQRMRGYVNHLADLEDMATFYDANKYTLLAVKVGNLAPSNGRPYQILFLQNKQDNNYYIFINLHNGHRISKDQLEKKLSYNLNRGNIPIQISIGNPSYNDGAHESDISDIINGKNFKVIMAGDTNDHGNYDYWQGLQPFSKSDFYNLNNIIIKSTLEPPLTCCSPLTSWDKPIRTSIDDDNMLGDYILVSENLHVSVNNRILECFNYNAEVFPTSDHLPVEIILNTIPIRSDGGALKNKEKYLKYKQKYLELKKTLF
jgi:hypothetical protein